MNRHMWSTQCKNSLVTQSSSPATLRVRKYDGTRNQQTLPKLRIIPRLEIKGVNTVKGIRMEGLRKVGSPEQLTQRYFDQGADELVFVDIVASLYGRNNLQSLVEAASANIHVPLVVGGGVRNLEDFRQLLRSGADKISLNTQALTTPEIISHAADVFGAQCVVISIQAKRQSHGEWEAYCENGREPSGKNVVEWAKEVVSRGAGEVLLTSVDQDGTRKGLDLDLVGALVDAVSVPVIAGSGIGSIDDVVKASRLGVTGVAIAHMLHFNRFTIPELKDELIRRGVDVRPLPVGTNDAG